MSDKKNPTKSFFLLKEGSCPNFGFTTGTCAQAASVAAGRMLFSQRPVSHVILTTPKGIKVCIEISDQTFSENAASCSVRKFSGDDPDVTDGIKVFSTVRRIPNEVTDSQRDPACRKGGVRIVGGEGVGRVTLRGLDQEVGEAAINSVPRRMIAEGLEKEMAGYRGNAGISEEFSLEVEISVPGGEEIALRTFNPRLGIVGGISILGTSGIVEPMSERAVLDTIRAEMSVRKAQGLAVLPLVPGNYGSDFLRETYGFPVDKTVRCSNFVYDSLQIAREAGFGKVLFCGHIGKLLKVALGAKNTHSEFGDGRMESLLALARGFAPEERLSFVRGRLMACVSTEDAVSVLDSLDSGHRVRNLVMREAAARIQGRMTEWTEGEMMCEVVIFTKRHGILAETEGAADFIKEIKGSI